MIQIDGLKYFFSFINTVPPQFSTPAFSVKHLSILAFLIVVYIILTAVFKGKNAKARSKYLLIMALLLPLSNLANEYWLFRVGHFGVETELPLQLCGTMYILIPLMVLFRNRLLMEFVYACGMPGAFFAMLTPGTQGYYFISWGFLIYMIIHSLIVYVPLFMLITGEFRPEFHHLHKVAGLFLGLVMLDFLVDHRLGSNYLYLREVPKGTLLDTFQSWVGNPGYIIVTLFVILLVWTALYLPWSLFDKSQQRKQLSAE